MADRALKYHLFSEVICFVKSCFGRMVKKVPIKKCPGVEVLMSSKPSEIAVIVIDLEFKHDSARQVK